MDYMTVKQAAEKWERSVRWVQVLCQTGSVPGAIRFGRDWMIPKDAQRPTDRRIKSGKYIKSGKGRDGEHGTPK